MKKHLLKRFFKLSLLAQQLPWILLFVIMAVLLLDPYLPLATKSTLLAISLTLKSGIIFVLPVIIFGLLFKTVVRLSSMASVFILIALGLIILSNFISTLLSSIVGSSIYHFDLHFSNPTGQLNLEPYWSFTLPTLIPNSLAMFLGVILGILLPLIMRRFSEKLATQLDRLVHFILKVILFTIPFFILGFIVKLKHDGIIQNMFKEYSIILLMIVISLIIYISFLYFLSARFNITKTIYRINNMLPAAMIGFSSMSSAIALPLTILATEKNAFADNRNINMTRTVIPVTVNIHLIGDCFAIPIFAYAILKNYGLPEPTFINYLIFAFNFVMAKFTVAAIPGGGILVMLSILESYLGFNAPMLSLITALYILFDPIITCANVLGNGAFALLVSLKKKPARENRSEAVADQNI